MIVSIYFSASIAAIHPDPAAETACLYVKSCTSPAAKTPLTEVRVELFSVII